MPLIITYILLCLWINTKADYVTFTGKVQEETASYSQIGTTADCPYIPSSQVLTYAQSVNLQSVHRNPSATVTAVAIPTIFPKRPTVHLPVVYYVHFLQRLII